MKNFGKFVKGGIVMLVILCGITGYAMSFSLDRGTSWGHFVAFLIGLSFLSMGSLALNQVQEWQLDQKMARTGTRPIPAGIMSAQSGLTIAIGLLLVGTTTLFLLKPLVGWLGIATVVLYNGAYTLHWKKKWVFGAVPGAVPGAMPVVMGYAANNSQIFSSECLYMFFIMFLWQMPHFWSLAIRFADDYKRGGIPVPPVTIGIPKTIFQIGLYTFVYVALAVGSPYFVHAKFVYMAGVLPMAAKVVWEFIKFYRDGGRGRWLPFFLWTNFSVLGFLAAPVVDKWIFILGSGISLPG